MSSPSSRHRNNAIKFFQSGGAFITYQDWVSGAIDQFIHKSRTLLTVENDIPPTHRPLPVPRFDPIIKNGFFAGDRYWISDDNTKTISWDIGIPGRRLYKNGIALILPSQLSNDQIIAACIDNDDNVIAVIANLHGLNYDISIVKYNKFSNVILYQRVFKTRDRVIYMHGCFLSDCKTLVIDGALFKFSADYLSNSESNISTGIINIFYSKKYLTLVKQDTDGVNNALSTIRVSNNNVEAIINRYNFNTGSEIDLLMWADDDNELVCKCSQTQSNVFFNSSIIASKEIISDLPIAITLAVWLSYISWSAFDGELLTACYPAHVVDYGDNHGASIIINTKTGQIQDINYNLSRNPHVGYSITVTGLNP